MEVRPRDEDLSKFLTVQKPRKPEPEPEPKPKPKESDKDIDREYWEYYSKDPKKK